MIPKIIHYCWFGGSPFSEQAIKCIESWKKYCEGYEIIEWNESNFDIHCNTYVEEAYNQKKWAFVSDYARLYIIYNQGGFYFDTDVELIKCIDDLRLYEVFFAQEVGGMVSTGLGFGAEKGNAIVKSMLDEYKDAKFILNDGELDLLPCPIRNTKVLFELGYKRSGQTENVKNAKIFSSDFFCPYDYVKDKTNITSNTYSIHHYEGSWDYPLQIREKYKVFYSFFGHHIGHFICEVGEKIKNEGFAKTVRFIQYRIKNKMKKVWMSNGKNVYRASITEQIDFVITWVDGDDIKWKQEKKTYLKDKNVDNRDMRYRDWDNLHFWFRGIEKYAAWVNKIYFVTNGQIPAWLNLEHEKLVVVTHEEFMERKNLPTFNSAAIEVNLHKIKGLSEKFVYFNDDMFVIAPVKKTDFFIHNLPVDKGIENVIPLKCDKDLIVNSIMRNHTMLINKHFNKKRFIRSNWYKWFSLRNGKDVIRNILLLFWKDFCGFKTFHLPTPFLKSTFYQIGTLEKKVLDETSSHRFRMEGDVSQWLFQNWQIVSGKYVLPRRSYGRYVAADIGNANDICDIIKKRKYRILCINDEIYDNNFERVKDTINHAFEEIFSEKSSFEK